MTGRISETAPFYAYSVINDGGTPGQSKYLQSLGTSNISTAPSAFSRPGQPETRQRERQKRRPSGKPSPMPIGTPSNAMAGSTTLHYQRAEPSPLRRRQQSSLVFALR